MKKLNPYRERVSSTKLHLALFAMALIALGFGMTGWSEHAFDGFVMGILGAAAIYTGGNVTEKLRASSPPADQQLPSQDKVT